MTPFNEVTTISPRTTAGSAYIYAPLAAPRTYGIYWE